jgi:hypothetical protein
MLGARIGTPVGRALAFAVMFALATAAALAAEPARVVFCAPGYPGTTEQAQPSMDAFAERLGAEAGLPGKVAAVYHESDAEGLRALSDPSVVAAVVTLPFFLAHRAEAGLVPELEAVPVEGDPERWSLVAAKGAIGAPADLAGWEIASLAGYVPAFVRGPALGEWGELPEATAIAFTNRPLSALRKASRGERVAVLLDAAQHAALEGLPFAGDLETLHRSGPMPGSLLCTVGEGGERAAAVVRALASLSGTAGGAAALESLRLTGFREPDTARLAEVEERYVEASRP